MRGGGTEIGSLFLIFLRLGTTSFGGPIAHLGYMHDEFVTRRAWLGEESYADLVALCQFLPGPASSQVGMAIGFSRGGYAGALAAWAGFTLPSAVLMMLFALGISGYGGILSSGVLHGLKIVAVAVVAQAVWTMAAKLCTDRTRVTIMTAASGAVLLLPGASAQLGAIAAAAVAGYFLFDAKEGATAEEALHITANRRSGALALTLFFALLLGLPLLARRVPGVVPQIADAFYRAGSLVFGGGHVILPLLQAGVVSPGWMSDGAFLAGYGAAQAVPGPLLSFSAFLGTSMLGIPGGLLCLVAIFTPSFLLIVGALPFWESLRRNGAMRRALIGINASVVGILLAALYSPVWTAAILSPRDFFLGLAAFVALMFWKVSPWIVVIACGVAGGIFL